jgi:hypothetical protein
VRADEPLYPRLLDEIIVESKYNFNVDCHDLFS